MTYLTLIAAGLKPQRLRTLLTIASLAIAFLLFGLLQPVRVLFTQSGATAGADRLAVLPKHSIADLLPERYAAQIGELPGVRGVAHQTWFGGTFRDPSNVFARWAVPPSQFLDLHPEMILRAEERQAFTTTRASAIIGRAAAEKYGLHVGDSVPLIPDIWNNKSGTHWEFQLVGVYDVADGEASDMFINYDYFDESRAWGRGQISYLVVGLDHPDRASDTAARIDAMFANSQAETRTASEQQYALSFAAQIGNVGLIVVGILSAVFFTIAILTANTLSQSIRERTAEIGVLRTLGFQRETVFGLILAEAFMVTVVGAATGLLVASAFIRSIRSLSAQLSSVHIGIATLLWALVIAIAIAIIAGAQPAWRATRLRITDALRGT